MRSKLRLIAAAAVLTLLVAGGSSAEKIPPLTVGRPAPGKRVKQITAEYRGTQVFHSLYLPTNWKENRLHPVIVEFPPSTYTVERTVLGYYQSGGKGFIWMVTPFISLDKKRNDLGWWGNREATLEYCKTNLKRIYEKYGGDTSAIFLTGFSRGAMAVRYMGLYDEEMADIWIGFIPYGGYNLQPYPPLSRIRGRPTLLICGQYDGLKSQSIQAKAWLRQKGFPVQYLEIPRTVHIETWIFTDSPQRRAMRKWIAGVLEKRPGTFQIKGTVKTEDGKPIVGARLESGNMHWTFTDNEGVYVLRGLTTGRRTLRVSKQGCLFRPARMKVTITSEHLDRKDFVGARLRR